MTGRRGLLGQRTHEPGLADARLPGHEHRSPNAVARRGPALLQSFELGFTADQRCEAAASRRVEPTLDPRLAAYRVSLDGRAEALEFERAQADELEQTADQPTGALADHHLARAGNGLKPCREVRRLANDGLLARGALAKQIADNDEPGADADAGCQRLARRGALGRHRAHGAEPSQNCSLGRILLRHRPPEIGQYAVTHEFGDMAAEPLDLGHDSFMVGAR